jgi:molybdopterin synthase catalytic subunit
MVFLTHEPLVEADVRSAVTHSGAGAVLVFHGITRDNFAGREVLELSYEAYPAMACAQMQSIVDEAAERWPGVQVAIGHRLGVVPVSEASVLIAVSAPHRGDCYDASRFAIDTLKARVPIWKKEHYSDGSAWKANKESGCGVDVGSVEAPAAEHSVPSQENP